MEAEEKVAKCIRCGKPCASGETMCDECKAWFREKTGRDAAPGFNKIEARKTKEDVSVENTETDQEKKNRDITIQSNTENVENNKSGKQAQPKKRVIITASLIAIVTLVVLICVINHKNRTTDANLQSNIETNESKDECLLAEADEPELNRTESNSETESEEIISSDESFNEESDPIYFVKNVEIGLNMRSEPKHDSALVYTVEDYSQMEYLGENGEGYGSDNELHTWYKVRLNGHIGWVRSDLVNQDDSSGAIDAVSNDSAEPFYGVWVSATKSESEAEKMCNELISKGFDALVIKTSDWSNLNPETYYAISIGAHARKEDAEAQLSVMKRNGYESAYVKYSGDCLIY